MERIVRNVKTNNRKRMLIILISALVAILIAGSVALYALAVSIYDSSFSYRCTTSEEQSFSIEEFPSLSRTRHTFASDQGQTLVGYLYECDAVAEKKGVIVFAHGLGAGGQCGYMDIFDYMASAGYYVFAYDATANDESEGEVIGGLPQGIIDLDFAINYAQTIEQIRDPPFVLVVYSSGVMSVVNALVNHPEIKAAVTLAGWNKSMNMIDYRGCEMVGGVAKLLLPFASVYEYTMYGDYAFSTSMKGFAKTDCPVMIVHGEEDDTIPIRYGYETYYKKYGDDDRFVFKKYEDRDHEVMRGADGKHDMALMAEIVAFLDGSLQ